MPFDRCVVGERLTTGCSRGKRYKFWREHCIGAERGRNIRGQWRNSFVEAYRHQHSVLLVCACFALFGGEMPHRQYATGWCAGIAHLRIYFYTGHIFIIDLQGPCWFFEVIPRQRESERSEQHDTARDHGQGDKVIG